MPTLNTKEPRRPWKMKEKPKNSPERDQIYKEVYGTRRWRRLRAIQLARQPLCQECEKVGRVTPATVADHKTPIRQGGEKWSIDNLQSLCARCHQAKTNKEQKK